MDQKGIARAHIICHSAGGDEATFLATQYPERVGKLVYLDAAYDRRDISKLEKDDPMGAAKPSSREQELHWRGMDAFRPDFKSIKAPVLSFYAIYERHFAVDDKTPADSKAKATKFLVDVIQPYQMNNIAQFRKLVPHAKVVELRGTHHYFFEDPKQQPRVVKMIREFLAAKS